MQQFCTYGSVRGAFGQPASLPRQKAKNRLPALAARKRARAFVGTYSAATARERYLPGLFTSLLGGCTRSQHSSIALRRVDSRRSSKTDLGDRPTGRARRRLGVLRPIYAYAVVGGVMTGVRTPITCTSSGEPAACLFRTSSRKVHQQCISEAGVFRKIAVCLFASLYELGKELTSYDITIL